MLTYTVSCPACGKSFENSDEREYIFCIHCGKRLHMKWTIECTVADDTSSASSAQAYVVNPESSGTRSSSFAIGDVIGSAMSHGNPGGPARFTIRVPDSPMKMSGNFQYFQVRVDSHDVGQIQLGGVVPVESKPGKHHIEVKQVNSGFLGNNTRTFTFNVDAVDGAVFNIMSTDNELIL